MSRLVGILLLVQLFTFHNYLFSQTPITNFPVIEDFESGIAGWTAGGTGNTWALGTPTKSVIIGAHSGSKAWVTGGLTGLYGNNELNWVQSPAYNFSNAVKPVVSLWIWRECEFSMDGAVLQQSLNNGTWTTIGNFNDPGNWYNDNTINGLPGGIGWTGSSNGWVKATHELSADVIGQTSVRFRILFGSNGSVAYGGFAFDDFAITMDRYPLPSIISQSDFGNVLDFDGIDDFVRVPIDTFRQTVNGFTVETWVKWKSGGGAIFYVGGDVADYFVLDKSGLTAKGLNYNGGKGWSIPITTSIDNNWHHVAATVDKVKNEGRIYVDGVLSGSFPNSITIPDRPLATQLWSLSDLENQLAYGTIGRNETYSIYAHTQLDEFRIWNYARSASEINANKSIPLSGGEPGLIFKVDFNEGVPSGNNSSIGFLTDKVVGVKSEIFGFAREGSSSNFIQSKHKSGSLPVITSVSHSSSIAGKEISVYGGNFGPTTAYSKIFFGDKEAEVLSIASNVIRTIVPAGITSVQKISVLNSNGVSNKQDFTIISPLSQRNFTFTQKEIYSRLLNPRSIAVADMNNDNLMDIVAGGFGPLSILTNSGDNTYAVSVVSSPSFFSSLSIADFDNDEDLDIICKDGSDLVVFKNVNNVWIKFILASSISGEALLADIDSDGYLDVVTINSSARVGWLKNTGLGTLGGFTTINNSKIMRSVGIGDLNGDNQLDIVCVDYLSDNFKVYSYINNGTGIFTEFYVGVGTLYGDAVRIGDFDNDGRNDILHNGYQGNSPTIFYNTGNNTYQSVQIAAYEATKVTQMDLVDMNGDGRLDFLLSRNDPTNQLNWFINNGRFATPDFTRQLISNNVFNALDIKGFDADNDGDLDVISASRDDNRIAVYYHLFADNDFASYSLDDQTSPAVISESNHTVDIAVRNETFLAKLLPKFSTSLKSLVKIGSVNQLSSETVVDFSAPGNSALYTITAENGESQEWTVRIHPLPAAPSLNSITTITGTGATINWTNNSFTSSVVIEVLKVSADNSTSFVAGYDPKEVSGGSHTIVGLTSGSTYQVRLKGKNSYGLSEDYSSLLSFATLPLAPSLNPVVNITQVAASVSWGSVSGASSYRLDLLKDNGSTFVSPYNNFEVIPSNLQLTGLAPGTSYQIRIRSNNVSGSSTNFASASFITIPSEPVAKEATLKTSTSFQANWDAASTASSYIVELSENAFLSIQKEKATALTSSTFTGLELGKPYAYRVRAINASGISGNSNAIIVVPSYSVSITNESFDANTLTASVTAISSAGIQKVVMYYRGIATGEYTAVDVPLKSGTTYEISITEAMQDVMGCEYYFSVTDGLNDKRSGVLNYAYKKIEALDKQTISISRSGRGAANYNLFSVPYQLDDDNMSAVFDPVLGAYDINKWRLLRYQDGRHVEYGAGLTKLEPGKGYWFASLKKVDISVSEGGVVEANRTKPYFLNLLRGWNQIGNPYPYAISWNDIRSYNDNLTGISDLYVFDAGSFKKGDLAVWGGGFILSERDQVLEIPVNFAALNETRRKQPVTQGTDINSKSWALPMTLVQGDVRNELIGVGMDPGASDQVDELDEQNLPRFIDYLEMHTLHQEYFVPQFMRDVVQTKISHTWTFHVESSDQQEPITLQWNNQEMGNGDAQLFLIDESEQQVLNMKQFNSYTFESTSNKMLRFVYAIDKESVEGDFVSVGRPYPNPFRQHTRIPIFGAKEGAQVSVQIYDLHGRQLTHLTHVSTTAYEEITWEGTDAQGAPLQPGVYVYKIQFSSNKYFIGRVVLN
jgi:hypothetical protein